MHPPTARLFDRLRDRRGRVRVRSTDTRPAAAAAERLEERRLLTAYLVNTTEDVVANDGLLSLREAFTAANADAAFADAPAGSGSDRIAVAGFLANQTFHLNRSLRVSSDLVFAGRGAVLTTAPKSGPDTREPSASGTVLAVDLRDGTQAVLVGVILRGGRADRGGGVRFLGRGPAAALGLKGVRLERNSATDSGGGLYQQGGRVVLTVSLASDNTATDGAGAAVFGGEFVADRSTLTRNAATRSGGAVFATAGGFVDLRGGRIERNTAAAYGGAVALAGGTRLEADGVEFFINAAGGGGATLSDQSPGDGGALALLPHVGDTTRARVVDSQFFGNRAGGAGGTISHAGGTLRLDRTNLVRGTATRGGGAALDARAIFAGVAVGANRTVAGRNPGRGAGVSVGAGGLLHAWDSLFFDNAAAGSGGGLHNAGRVTLERSRIELNAGAGTGGGLTHTAAAFTDFYGTAITGTPDDPQPLAGTGTFRDEAVRQTRLRLLTPTPGQVFQRVRVDNGGGGEVPLLGSGGDSVPGGGGPGGGGPSRPPLFNTSNVDVAGTYDETAFGTGGPGPVLARWTPAGGTPGANWVVLDAAPTGGTFGGELTDRPTGWATLEVRFESDPVAAAVSTEVAVGDVFLLAGQSNAFGRARFAPFAEPPPDAGSGPRSSFTGSVPRASLYAGGGWASVTDFSAWPVMADAVARGTGIPLGFVKFATVGAELVASPGRWNRDAGGPHGGTSYRGALDRVAASGVNALTAVLWHQGETDAVRNVGRDVYREALRQLARNFRDELPGAPPLVVAQIGGLNSGTPDAVRQAQADLWDGNPAGGSTGDAPTVLSGPTLYDIPLNGDGLHFYHHEEVAPLGERWALAVRGHFYDGAVDFRGPRVTTAALSGDRRTVRLTFDRDLAPAAGPYGGFRVTVGGAAIPQVVAARSGARTVDLRLTAPLPAAGPAAVSLGRGGTTDGRPVPAALTDGVLLPAEFFVGLPVSGSF